MANLGVQQLELGHLGALLLATGESLVDRTLGEVGVELLTGQGVIDLLDPGAQLRGPASGNFQSWWKAKQEQVSGGR